MTGQGTNATHNIVIDEVSGFLYRAGGGSNGLRIPASPTPATRPSSASTRPATCTTRRSSRTPRARTAAGRSPTAAAASTEADRHRPDDPRRHQQVEHLGAPPAQLPRPPVQPPGLAQRGPHAFYLGDELDEGASVSTTTTRSSTSATPGTRPTSASSTTVATGDRPQHVLAQRAAVPGELHLGPARVRHRRQRPEPDGGGLLRHGPVVQRHELQRPLELLPLLPERHDHRQRHRARPVRPLPGRDPARRRRRGAGRREPQRRADHGRRDRAHGRLSRRLAASRSSTTSARASRACHDPGRGLTFTASLPPVVCGSAVDWYITASTNAARPRPCPPRRPRPPSRPSPPSARSPSPPTTCKRPLDGPSAPPVTTPRPASGPVATPSAPTRSPRTTTARSGPSAGSPARVRTVAASVRTTSTEAGRPS